MTVAEIHSVLWDVSSDALRDATDMRSLVKERDSSLALRDAQMPEEATTINLARRIALAFSADQRKRATVVLHTRGLEGGNNKQKQKSKADLELCIEVAPGKYCDLVLQAKRLAVNTSGCPEYKGWDPANNQQLIKWAQTSGQTPGMILYNEELDPFFPWLPDLGILCKRAVGHSNQVYYPEWKSGNYGRTAKRRGPAHPRGPRTPNPHTLYPGSPAGILICLNQGYMTGIKDPCPCMVWDKSFPWEHLMHNKNCTGFSYGSSPSPQHPGGAAPTAGPNVGGDERDDTRKDSPYDETREARQDREDGVQIKDRLPAWAVDTLEQAGKEIPEESIRVEDTGHYEYDSEWTPPTASIVIQLADHHRPEFARFDEIAPQRY